MMGVAVGIVGLGPMGLAIASRLRDTGFSPVGTSRSQATRQRAGIDVAADVCQHPESGWDSAVGVAVSVR